jgi:DNA-binding response OmpR family regulator
MRILIVDDYIDTTDMLGMVLELAGHEVLAVHTGMAALAALVTFRPDLVLLDVGLPDISGYDVARAIRASGSHVRLIAATGWGTPADREEALAAGCDQHLIKPYDLGTLRSAITNGNSC